MAFDKLNRRQLLEESLYHFNEAENSIQSAMRRLAEAIRREDIVAAPEPEPAPEPAPVPDPEPIPAPAPEPTPAPEPAPDTEPEPAPAPAPVYAPIVKIDERHARWADRKWRVNTKRQPHSLQVTADRARFEIRPEDFLDGSKPRSELSGSIYGDDTRLPNGVLLRGGFTLNAHAWGSDMSKTWGGVYGQIHIGSKVGGSPALSFRRDQDGDFKVATRGEKDLGGTTQWKGPLPFDEEHDIVYCVKLHPTEAELRVWIDREPVLDLTGVSIGHSIADAYWALGLYFSGGITGPIVAEYSEHTYPSPDGDSPLIRAVR
ncbi:hypothetical protein [Allopontixanthobacter sp.]|uniref:hypothetical protein n=1 Tax=Allopontixanthobacter sp. TaxID=2906452 RepID=UPI002AB8821A|nr:hypothetical protein [Allopontixanthobacter sp.]MDZ4306605.1 hypothetical protein [Allopontixanthobacter sp.]